MPPPVGIIITVSVLVAASIAAYENPQVRAWIDRTRHKIAMGLHSLGDEIGPRNRPPLRRTSTDISMCEDKGEQAEERRRQAVAEIMERGRILEERRKRRKLSEQENSQPQSPTFDNIVDENGLLLQDVESQAEGQSSGVDNLPASTTLRQRPGPSGPVDAPPSPHVSLRQLDPRPGDAFESRYEQEMRDAWNLPLSERRIEIPPSHASESLIELTPTTEGAPDPDFSIPSAEYLHQPMNRSEYFSAAASNSTHTLSDRESQPPLSVQSSHHFLPQGGNANGHAGNQVSASLTPSIAGSVSNIHASEAEDSSDDVLSELGDGIRTPASAWTDVDSTVSGDFHL
ncbi:hypothetical protein G647_08234 [Cladophialophora carrionii CBS 160.54]|uniref:Uncharacterized protein n=1 Tax=Cladophialophora carrionii CBS 160.54 TaxID=1279043 RepID=V9CZX3_9EURO|nr:uncharacterized protein G647_08234 [Cladophialophora carrionii CBS 160.54]ETI20200.1 hypothetical protein G647_08234 [Cladophialophora carrionii CBS 160.54]